jgi:hypothetical protein
VLAGLDLDDLGLTGCERLAGLIGAGAEAQAVVNGDGHGLSLRICSLYERRVRSLAKNIRTVSDNALGLCKRREGLEPRCTFFCIDADVCWRRSIFTRLCCVHSPFGLIDRKLLACAAPVGFNRPHVNDLSPAHFID